MYACSHKYAYNVVLATRIFKLSAVEFSHSLQIGEVLCRYEVEKKLAIEREDYDTAKQKKVRIEVFI